MFPTDELWDASPACAVRHVGKPQRGPGNIRML